MQVSKRVKVLIVGAASVVTFLAAAPLIGGASLVQELGSESPVQTCSNVGGHSHVGGQSNVGGQSCTGPSTMITLSSTSLTGRGKETITGKQFVVGERVFLYLFLDTKKLRSLGVVKAKTGSFKTKVLIAGVTAGTHTITALGTRGSSASVNFEMLPSIRVTGSPVLPGHAVRSNLAAFHANSRLTFFLLPRSAAGDCPGALPATALTLGTSPSKVVTGSKGRNAGTATASVEIPSGTPARKFTVEARDPEHVRACADITVK